MTIEELSDILYGSGQDSWNDWWGLWKASFNANSLFNKIDLFLDDYKDISDELTIKHEYELFLILSSMNEKNLAPVEKKIINAINAKLKYDFKILSMLMIEQLFKEEIYHAIALRVDALAMNSILKKLNTEALLTSTVLNFLSRTRIRFDPMATLCSLYQGRITFDPILNVNHDCDAFVNALKTLRDKQILDPVLKDKEADKLLFTVMQLNELNIDFTLATVRILEQSKVLNTLCKYLTAENYKHLYNKTPKFLIDLDSALDIPDHTKFLAAEPINEIFIEELASYNNEHGVKKCLSSSSLSDTDTLFNRFEYQSKPKTTLRDENSRADNRMSL